MPDTNDPSNGYDAIADTYIQVRSRAGRVVVADWANKLPSGASVLDLGAGYGEPYMSVLLDADLSISAIDASPSMVSAFRMRFPTIDIACEPVESSHFFNKSFDAVLAVGLIFLLPESAQKKLIEKVAKAMKPGGRFLMSAPIEAGTWDDLLTSRLSISLGEDVYRAQLSRVGFSHIENVNDDAGSHYYSAVKE
ncbi:MAG: class I SAM-dependent methyltransferase [Henriciella sp.]